MAKSKKRKLAHVSGKPTGMNLIDTVSYKAQAVRDCIATEANGLFMRYQRRLVQMCIDSAFMAANDMFHMGPTRCEAFGKAIVEYINGMAGMIIQDAKDDDDFVYAKAKIDQRLKQICGDKFQPWEERYEDRT